MYLHQEGKNIEVNPVRNAKPMEVDTIARSVERDEAPAADLASRSILYSIQENAEANSEDSDDEDFPVPTQVLKRKKPEKSDTSTRDEV